ncbi:unnamed protein product, partial [Rotaria magnacalcarata]
MAKVYSSLGEYHTAMEHAEIAVQIAQEKLDENNPYIIGYRKLLEEIQNKF